MCIWNYGSDIKYNYILSKIQTWQYVWIHCLRFHILINVPYTLYMSHILYMPMHTGYVPYTLYMSHTHCTYPITLCMSPTHCTCPTHAVHVQYRGYTSHRHSTCPHTTHCTCPTYNPRVPSTLHMFHMHTAHSPHTLYNVMSHTHCTYMPP